MHTNIFTVDLVNYCRKIFAHRAQISTAYTSDYRNYGLTTTQLGESGHYGSKSFLCGRNNELAQMLRGLDLSSNVYEDQYEAQISKESLNVPRKYQNVDLIRHLVFYISKAAMAMIWQQYIAAVQAYKDPEANPLGPCTDKLQKQMGIPCRHYIFMQCLQKVSDHGKPLKIVCVKELQKEDISHHWWLRSRRVCICPIQIGWANDFLVGKRPS